MAMPLPRIIMAENAGAHGLHERARRHAFPATTSTISRRCSCRKFPARPPAPANLWGFVDLDDNREYAVLGHRNGTAFYDVTTPGTPVLVGNVPGQCRRCGAK